MLAKILDFAPAIAFFVTYRWSEDLVLATSVIIACCLLSFTLQYLLWRKASRMQVFLTIAVLLFGLPTILLKDPAIIMWKPSIVNWILAITIFVCQFILRRNPFAYLFGKEMPIPEHIWFKLGSYFMVYFVFAGLLNMVIAFHLPQIFNIDAKTAESYWVDYKTFGSTIINVTFTLFVFLVIMRRHPEAFAAFKDVHKAKTNQDENTSTQAPNLACAQKNFENSENESASTPKHGVKWRFQVFCRGT